MPRPRRISPWFVGAGLLIILVALSMALWRWKIEPIQHHGRLFNHARVSIENLVLHRPPGVTRAQWQYVVGWTLNAHGNCCSFYGAVDLDGLARFSRELDDRIERDSVDMGTIDWIWDQYERISRVGPEYSRRFRPTRPDRLAEATSNTFVGVNVP